MSTQNVRIEQLGDDMVDETIHLLVCMNQRLLL